MTLRKITIDNSVKYIPQGEQTKKQKTKERDFKSYTTKQNHFFVNGTKIFHKIIKNSLKIL